MTLLYGPLLATLLLITGRDACLAEDACFHISVDGNDAWSGTLPEADGGRTDGPVQTLTRARDLARQWRKAHPTEEQPVTLIVHRGYYYLAEPLVLTAEDSNLTLAGASGETATIGAGRSLTGWTKSDDKFWSAPAPGTDTDQWDFRTLIVNGRWAKRAWLPRTGFFEHLSIYNEPWRSTTGGGFGQVPDELKRSMIYKPEDLASWLSQKNVELVIYHSWDMSNARIEKNDTASHTLTLTPILGYPAGAFGIHRYRVQNLKEGLHEPGTWYLDRDNARVVYWPLPGEDMGKAEAIAPVGAYLIDVRGTAEAPVRKLTLRDLTLADTNVPWKSAGFAAAGLKESALTLAFVQESSLRGLQLRNLGGNGIRIFAGGSNRISGCEFNHIGAGGLIADGTEAPGGGDNLTVIDNHFHHIGLVYIAAIALRGGNIANGLIARNLIHDCGYSGICFGGDAKTPRATNTIIESNHIYRVMTDLNDGGGIYVGGKLDGMIIRKNICHDILGLTGQGWGIYPDEQSQNITITGNLTYRCRGNFLAHMTHDLTIENNIFAFGRDYGINIARNTVRATLRRNIVVTAQEPIFADQVNLSNKEQFSACDGNLYFSVVSGRPALGNNVAWDAWLSAGFDANSVIVDPLLVDVGKDNFTLKPDSPALKLGFVPLDLGEVPPAKE